MKSRHYTLLLVALTMFTSSTKALQQPHPDGDDSLSKTESPFFQVNGETISLDAFPLKSTEVQAEIAGIIASVTVEQTYCNEGDKPIEATYVFPASTRAAVHGLTMQIGQRVVKAEIQKKEDAKKTFEAAKEASKSAALLQQQRPNVFEMKVANILPGDEVRVTLTYSEKLFCKERVYQFMYPTVVGPRYQNATAAHEKWVENPYIKKGNANPTTFKLNLELNAGMPVQSAISSSHDAMVQFTSPETVQVKLEESREHADRDFIFHYQLADQQVASGLLLHQSQDAKQGENFFLLNLQPPARVEASTRLPREYIFVVDVSGSMEGFPLDTAKSLMTRLIKGMRPTDTFNIVLFAASSKTLSPKPLEANEGNLQRAFRLLDSSRAGGGTELASAVRRALALPKQAGNARNIVLITDGYVTVEKETFELVRENLQEANFFTFGIGSSVNRWLIEGLAHVGRGEPFVVTSSEQAEAMASRFRSYIESPVLTDIEVAFEGFETYAVTPKKLPDLFAERSLQVMGKWKGPTTGRIVVHGRSAGTPYHAVFDVAQAASEAMNHPALPVLWARDRIYELDLMNKVQADHDTVAEITNLGLTYSLLTEYTSFVGVDNTPREMLGKAEAVHHPLPLPQGVSSQATSQQQVTVTTSGANSCSVPEPGVVSLLIVTAAALMLYRERRYARV